LYFHTKAVIKVQKNNIRCLKDINSQWVWDEDSLKYMTVKFYKKCFAREEGSGQSFPVQGVLLVINQVKRDHLLDSVKNVIKGKAYVSEIHQTFLVLVPKVLKPEYLHHFSL